MQSLREFFSASSGLAPARQGLGLDWDVMNYRAMLIVCLTKLGLAATGWGQADGKIAFISDREGHSDVWIMQADGSNPVNLTQGRDCTSPAWSPDGAKIAYIDRGEIWLMGADGRNPQQVTDDSVDKARLWWSNDGSSIYYITALTAPIADEWDGPEAFVTQLDGSGSSPADWREVYHRFLPGRSPDGTQQATVWLWNGGGHVHGNIDIRPSVSDHEHPGLLLPESIQNRLIEEGRDRWRTFPTWSPDGMRVAFAGLIPFKGQFEIWAADIDGDSSVELTNGRIGVPHWSRSDPDNWVELTNGLGGHSPAWQPMIPVATSVEAQAWGRIKSLLSGGPRP